MKLAVIGSGYVGLVTGACLADMGNHVICLDTDEKKIESLRKGIVPFYEPGLSDLVKKNLGLQRLFFTTSYQDAVRNAQIIFLCLPTPEKPNGDANLEYLFSALDSLVHWLAPSSILVTKSTVPLGTNRRIKQYLEKKTTTLFFVVSNPEFLKEGAAIKDFQNPDRIVLGGEDQEALSLMTTLYKPFERVNKPILVTSYENAELIKYASNAMLAMRISFMNELAGLCEIAGADIKEIIKGIGLDERIGPRFLQAGIGYGGSCFPKDIKALAYAMEQRGLKANLLRAVDYVNEVQKRSLVPKLKSHLGPLEGKRIGIWGLSFKPRTDDVRNAPAFDVIDQLLVEGALVQVYDPVAMENAKKVLGNKVFYADSMYAAAEGASALVIATEWDDFRLPDFSQLKQLMRVPFIVDGRNLYQPAMMQSLGFAYLSVGRPFVGAAALKHGH